MSFLIGSGSNDEQTLSEREDMMAQETEVTRRTKKAVRSWAHLPEDKGLILDRKLSDLKPNAKLELLSAINDEFEKKKNLPIDRSEWEKASPKSVRDVRDLVEKHV